MKITLNIDTHCVESVCHSDFCIQTDWKRDVIIIMFVQIDALH